MCYNYSVPSPVRLIERFKVSFPEQKSFQRRFHVSSFDTPKLPVITNDKPTQIQLFSWGLIPFWAKDEKNAEELRMKTMNARSENIYDKPSFQQSAEQKHCLVLVDGFFEWQEVDGKKYPYYIRLKNHEPFALAGLWDSWTNKKTNEILYTYTVITTKANKLMEKIHNTKKRMPVILSQKDETHWLNKLTKEQVQTFLEPYPDEEMEAYTISKLITSKNRNPNIPEVLTPYSYPELQTIKTQQNLF
jgi:putative SOS response-associated peptidase YedK